MHGRSLRGPGSAAVLLSALALACLVPFTIAGADPQGLPADAGERVSPLAPYLGGHVPLPPRAAARPAFTPPRSTGAIPNDEPWWQPLSAVPRSFHAAVYDPVRGRVVVAMGEINYTGYPYDAQALELGTELRWTALPARRDYRGRAAPLALYDAANDRMLVYGGYTYTGECYNLVLSAGPEIHVLPLGRGGTWSSFEPAGPGPDRRHDHAGIVDPPRGRLLVFGGSSGTGWCRGGTYSLRRLADLWELNLQGAAAWHEIPVSGDVPSPGRRGTAFYDGRRDRMIFVAADSLWTMTLSPTGSWTRVPLAGAPTASGPAALDSLGDRVLMWTGHALLELPLEGPSAWRTIPVQGEAPAPGAGCTITWDPRGERLVLHGGLDAEDRTWFIAFRGGPRWEEQTALRNPELIGHQVVHDPVRDRMLAFRGPNEPAVLEMPLDGSRGTWRALPTRGEGPPAHRFSGAAYDPARDRVIFQDGAPGPLASPGTWALDLRGTPTWSRLPAALAPGQPDLAFSLTLDPRRDRLVWFGGGRWDGSLSDGAWQLRLGDPAASWEPIVVAGPRPLPRLAHVAVYDPVRDALVIQGGVSQDDAGNYVLPGDTWSLALSGEPRWTEWRDDLLHTDGAAMVYDPVRDRAVLTFGENSDGAWFCDLPGGNWYPFFPWWSFAPTPRAFHACIYDAVRDQVVVSGGTQGSGEVWALVFGTPLREVAVDVRPGDAGNAVNLGSNGLLPVAVLSAAAPPFDATTIDVASVRLAGAPVRVKPNGLPHVETADANGDGLADLVLHFETAALQLAPTDTVAKLTGSAPGNTTVRGQDRVRIVGGTTAGKKHGAEPAVAAASEPRIAGVRTLAGGRVAVAFALPAGAAGTLDLVDVSGRRVARVTVTGTGATQEQQLGDGGLPGGMYWARLAHGTGSIAKKVLVLP